MRTVSVILFLAALVLATGCAVVGGTKTAPDGSVLHLRSSRFLWVSEGVRFDLADTNGVRVSLSIDKSHTDVEALSALVEAAAKGAASGLKP